MRDPSGVERSICLKCRAEDRECLEFIPDNLDTDALDNGDFCWEEQQRDLATTKVLPCILESINAYEERTFVANSSKSALAQTTSPTRTRRQSLGASGPSSPPRGRSSISSPLRGPKDVAGQLGSSGRKSLTTTARRGAGDDGGGDCSDIICASAADTVIAPSTLIQKRAKNEAVSGICACGCPSEEHRREVLTKKEQVVIDFLRPYFQMLKLSYSVMQSVTDTVFLDIPRTEFTYGEIYDVAFLQFLNRLWQTYHSSDAEKSNKLVEVEDNLKQEDIKEETRADKIDASSATEPGTPSPVRKRRSAFTEDYNDKNKCSSDNDVTSPSHHSTSVGSSTSLLGGASTPTRSTTSGMNKINSSEDVGAGAALPRSPFHDRLRTTFNGGSGGRVVDENCYSGSFVDLGCGTGKACFLATLCQWQFRKCIGVELLPGLHELAQRLSKKMRLPNVEFQLGDVRDCVVPPDTKLVYVASTVFGPELLYDLRHKVLNRLPPSCLIVTLKNKLPDVEFLEETEILVSWGYSPAYVCRIPPT
ncbi:unnamed protein product [Amoebophrya sp. A25]|nr:unnamed protein product [Amoebophrya sp. A25]|eukprot:GSA25T00011041001.1